MKKYFIILILIAVLAGGIFLPRNFGLEKQVVFRAEKGEGSKEIASNLQKDGLVWWGPFFNFYVLISGTAHKLQAGGYFLSPSMNIPQIAGKLSSGDIAKAKITIPEGFTSEQIVQTLSRTVLDSIESRTVLDSV